MALPEPPPPGFDGGREFRTTLWSVVLAAQQEGSAQTAALDELFRRYWFPLYSYLRRTGHSVHDAEDLTQGFLASMIEGGDFASARRERGRFRSFLLGALKHFLSDERKKAGALKRGGGRPVVSIDAETAESRHLVEPVDHDTPETHFERQWARLVLDRVMDRLQACHAERGRAEVFAALQPCLGGNCQPVSYAEIGRRLNLNEGAVKVAVHRLRADYGRLLRDEIRPTVADESEIDDEIRALIRAACT